MEKLILQKRFFLDPMNLNQLWCVQNLKFAFYHPLLSAIMWGGWLPSLQEVRKFRIFHSENSNFSVFIKAHIPFSHCKLMFEIFFFFNFLLGWGGGGLYWLLVYWLNNQVSNLIRLPCHTILEGQQFILLHHVSNIKRFFKVLLMVSISNWRENCFFLPPGT